MQIRNLKEQEIPFASELAKVVYRNTIEPYCADQQMRQIFYEYVEKEALLSRYHEGKLMIWGVFDMGNLCAVGAMQPEGHITMLYVLPQYQRHGIGRELVTSMQKYAFSEYKLAKITVNATPAWTADYFRKCGFKMMKQQTGNGTFSSLEMKSNGAIQYKTRSIPPKILLGITMGFLILMVIIVLIYVISTII